MAMTPQGQYAKFYVGTAESDPTNEVNLATNVSLTLAAAEVENNNRSNGGYDSTDAGSSNWGITANVHESLEGDTALDALLDAYNAGTALSAKALTDDSTAARGPKGDWVVTQANRTEDRNARISWDFELKLYANATFIKP